MAAPPGFHSSILRSPPFICSDLARPVLCLCLCLSTWYGMEFRCSSGRSLLFRAEAGCVALAFLGSWVLAFLHAVGPGDPLVDTALLPDADADADARRAARCLSREASEARKLRDVGGSEAQRHRRRGGTHDLTSVPRAPRALRTRPTRLVPHRAREVLRARFEAVSTCRLPALSCSLEAHSCSLDAPSEAD